MAIITAAMTSTTRPSVLPTRSSSRCSGVVSLGASSSIPAIRPISVCIPVATTTARPRPYVTVVPLNTMLARSPIPASSGIGSASFATGRLSPVSAASAVCRDADVDEARIGGDRVAFLEEDDVAGDDLDGRNVPPLAVAHDARVRGRHLAQGRDRRFRPRLLHVAHQPR